jgi:N-acetylneuraminic acid mutarotase
MKIPISVVMLIAMICTEAFAWGVRGGGDGMRIAFEKAREHAVHITSRLNPRAIAQIADPEVRLWLQQNQRALAADIMASEHKWYVDKMPTCGWTNVAPNPGVIHLSYGKCSESINDFEEAGQLLIHESTHHLGIDENNHGLADKIAIAIYSAWRAGGLEWQPTAISATSPDAVKFAAMEYIDDGVIVQGGLLENDRTTNAMHKYLVNDNRWEVLNSTGAPSTFGAQAVWTGDKLVIWGGYKRAGITNVWQNSGAIYDKRSGQWTDVKCQFGPEELSDQARYEGAPLQTLVWTGSEVVVFGGALVAGKAPGGMFDPSSATHSCRQLSSTGYPRANIAHTAVWANDRMIIFGGNDNRAVSDAAATFNPKTNRWSAISSVGAPEARDGHTAVWTGSKMIVFGGRGASMRTLTIEGAIYDPQSGWSTFNSDTLFGRHGHTAVWSGNEMIVFGGKPTWTSGVGQYLNSVYALNPASMTWRIVESKTAPSARQNHAAVWTGNSLVVFGGQTDTNKLTATGGVFYP